MSDDPSMKEAIGYAIQGGVCYLKLRGELRHDCAGPLDTLIEHLFAMSTCEFSAVVIDLNDVSFMDSTAIGLLAGIARELLSRDLCAPTVFSTNTEINQLLRSLCLDEVFTLIEQPTEHPLNVNVNALALELSVGADTQCSGAAILRAHEALVELNEANRVAFQSVISLFREQLDG